MQPGGSDDPGASDCLVPRDRGPWDPPGGGPTWPQDARGGDAASSGGGQAAPPCWGPQPGHRGSAGPLHCSAGRRACGVADSLSCDLGCAESLSPDPWRTRWAGRTGGQRQWACLAPFTPRPLPRASDFPAGELWTCPSPAQQSRLDLHDPPLAARWKRFRSCRGWAAGV